MAEHNKTGQRGEAIARQYLEEKGYHILHTNWRYRRAEIDLIAMDGDILVFTEVKTRRSTAFGQPEEFVTPYKEQLLTAAAIAFMEETGYEEEIRFDIIAIVYRSPEDYELNHFPDAFFPGLA